MTRAECIHGHEDPPYVVLDGAICDSCGTKIRGTVRGHTFPFEFCVLCVREGLPKCSICGTTAIRYTQAVPA